MRITKPGVAIVVALLCGCDQQLPLDSSSPLAAQYARSTRAVRLVTVDSSCAYTHSDGVIGRNGGSLTLGAHELVVPRNAVERPTRFTITCSHSENLILNFAAVEIPTGQQITSFNRELQIKLSYADLGMTRAQAQSLLVVWLQDDAATGALVPVRSVVRAHEQYVIGWVNHFSRFAMGMN